MEHSISPVDANLRLTQLLAEGDLFAQAPSAAAPASMSAPSAGLSGSPTANLFEDVLSKAINALEGVTKSEVYANQLVDKYFKGQAELQDVMTAQAKMSIMVQLAVATVNSAVNTFKEVTQIQI